MFHNARKEKWAVFLVRGQVERRVRVDYPTDIVRFTGVIE